MKLSIRKKKVLYDFACPNHHNTVTRLKWLTALTVDPQPTFTEVKEKFDRAMQLGRNRKKISVVCRN